MKFLQEAITTTAVLLFAFLKTTLQESISILNAEFSFLSISDSPSIHLALIRSMPSNSNSTPISVTFYKSGANEPLQTLELKSDYEMNGVDHQITRRLPDGKKTLFHASFNPSEIDANQSRAIEYSIDGTNRIPLPNLSRRNGSTTAIKVCVFGDYSANLYYKKQGIDVPHAIEANNCSMNLFIGRINWELSDATGRYSFNPFVTLYQNNGQSVADKFAEIPSIFGLTGHDLRETSFFHSVELNGIVFIQITVEVFTMAKLVPGEQQHMVQGYFRESMYTELECKLQELYERPVRPWIIVYMTHPYEINRLTEPQKILQVNDTDRLFEIAHRYRIDLLTSCGAEGMQLILNDKQSEDPNAILPAYVQTTMVPCAGYKASNPSLQSECSYVVLDFNGDQLRYIKKKFSVDPDTPSFSASADERQQNVISAETIIKTKEKPYNCVEIEEE